MTAKKYELVANSLLESIEEGDFKAGQQLPVELELAERFEVNRVTVRRALAMLDERGIVRRERGKGTFVAGHVGSDILKPTLFVGDTESHLHRDLYLALSAECRDRETALLVFDSIPSESNLRQQAARLNELTKRSGAVILDMDGVSASLEPILTKKHCVRIYHTGPPNHALPGFQIQLNENGAAELAVSHLVAQGHRRIAFVGVAPENEPREGEIYCRPLAMGAPYRGFLRAIVEHGVDHRALGAYGDEKESERLYAEYLRHLDGWATAIVCNSDWRAMLLCHAATRVGIRIPDDVSIVGIGNTPWSEATRPKLTTVSLCEREAGLLAAQLCEARMPNMAVVCTIQPRLIDKESVRSLRNTGETAGTILKEVNQ